MRASSLQRERTGTRNRFFGFFLSGVVFSLLVHVLFFKRAEKWVMKGFSPESYDTIIPRTFRMERVEIDPKSLVETKETKKEIVPRTITEEKEVPIPTQMEQGREKKGNLLDQPKEFSEEEKGIRDEKEEGERKILPGIDWKEKEAATLDPTTKESQLVLPEPNEKESQTDGRGGSNQGTGAAKYSNLDQLLEGEHAVTSSTAPILMPTDLLFEYDSDQLKPAAAESLRKLGQLIMKNNQASFRIEGYTDSFGSEDYNLGLSMRRAEEVKGWLQKNMGIDSTRISTAGYGKSRLLVPGTGTVEQQQLNRRVEIVITTH
jgi:outer membrane protein OmpA-like peptidoglycan-associated protein